MNHLKIKVKLNAYTKTLNEIVLAIPKSDSRKAFINI
jgi:hypothetical protein